MQSEISYMLTIVAAGFAVNYALRALPFLFVIGHERTLPPWVGRLGAWISPAIIAGLVVYSYTALAWRTPGPFIAGIITVVIQLWKRNSLASIIAGTAVYMCLLNCGCTTAKPIGLDAENPSIEVKTTGIYVGGQWVKIVEVPKMLDDADVPKTETVHILLDGNVQDLTEARALMGVLAASGYTRPILVTKMHENSASRANSYYRDEDLVRHGDDIMFMVTREGVRFGLLTPIEPDEVTARLEKHHAQHDQLIRICGQAKDYQSDEVMSMMLQLEKIVRGAGFTNVKRYWLDDTKPKEASAPRGQAQPAARPNVGGRRAIRYKGATE